jgi:hypothetical protein
MWMRGIVEMEAEAEMKTEMDTKMEREWKVDQGARKQRLGSAVVRLTNSLSDLFCLAPRAREARADACAPGPAESHRRRLKLRITEGHKNVMSQLTRDSRLLITAPHALHFKKIVNNLNTLIYIRIPA